jgi:hypothetical protein
MNRLGNRRPLPEAAVFCSGVRDGPIPSQIVLLLHVHSTEVERDLRDWRPHQSLAGAHRLIFAEAPSHATWAFISKLY